MVLKTTILMPVATIPEPTTRTVLTGKPINGKDILNTEKATINPLSTRCANIPETDLCILMEAQIQAVEAQVERNVANSKLIALGIYLGL
jgi:hypothetical protein